MILSLCDYHGILNIIHELCMDGWILRTYSYKPNSNIDVNCTNVSYETNAALKWTRPWRLSWGIRLLQLSWRLWIWLILMFLNLRWLERNGWCWIWLRLSFHGISLSNCRETLRTLSSNHDHQSRISREDDGLKRIDWKGITLKLCCLKVK